MKNHELIEKVGGIDKAREIVAGAPAWPVIGFCITGRNYIFKECEYAPCGYSPLDNAWSEEYAILLVLIDDLRTAIAEHDHHWYGRSEEDELKAYELLSQEKIEGGAWLRGDFSKSRAALEAIESGHRELLGNSEQLDDVADIKYHVSPSCVVVNHD